MKLVIDAAAVIRLAREARAVRAGHALLAPTLLRSQALSLLHEAVSRGELAAADAHAQLARIGAMRIRLLGDAVLRRRAWDVADRLKLASTYDAEYVALVQLQADALVTLDPTLARRARAVIRVEPFAAPF